MSRILRWKMAVQIDPQNVVGRDRLIQQIWRKLQTQSLRFTAERRIGKTTVMRKMLADRNQIVQLLKSLAQDHYLTSDSKKRYAFRFPLIRQWWVLVQGLPS
jgi:hypothetical protein